MVPLLMFLGTFLVALSYMIHARMEPKFDTIRARLLVVFLAFMQPLGRGWARYFTWLKYKHTPKGVIAKPELGLPPASHKGSISKLDFWNETGYIYLKRQSQAQSNQWVSLQKGPAQAVSNLSISTKAN